MGGFDRADWGSRPQDREPGGPGAGQPGAESAAAQDPFNRRRISLRGSLLLVIVLCLAPLLGASLSLLYRNDQLQRQQVEQSTILLARKVVADFERELSAIEAALKVLATSPDLVAGDLRGFDARVREALVAGIGYNYVLSDAEGRQILNTLKPLGVPLPAAGNPPELLRLFDDRRTVLSNLFIGPVTRKPTVGMAVPVVAGGRVAYSLGVGLSPSRLNEILVRQNLPEGWLIAILDTSGTIAARSREADRFVGQKAVPSLVEATARYTEGRMVTVTKENIPVFTAYAKSDLWGWSVAVGAPVQDLTEQQRSSLARFVFGSALAILLGAAAALWLARRVVSSVEGLNQAALALGRGDAVRLPKLQLREADAVGIAIRRAAEAMRQVKHMAQHDPLTGLANRALLFEVAERQMALAERNREPMAVVALDLDGFKAVNDADGHAAGDAVLREAASRIAESIRASDIAARLGGDEFIVVLAQADRDHAVQTSRRIVDALARPYAGCGSAVSASAGVALFPDHGRNLEEVLACADRALYRAKASGKNRAVVA